MQNQKPVLVDLIHHLPYDKQFLVGVLQVQSRIILF